jgi:hypothetical protein
MEVEACCNIWSRVKMAVSEAMSTFLILDSDAFRFSMATLKLFTVDSRRFWKAPRMDLLLKTLLIAESISSRNALQLPPLLYAPPELTVIVVLTLNAVTVDLLNTLPISNVSVATLELGPI